MHNIKSGTKKMIAIAIVGMTVLSGTSTQVVLAGDDFNQESFAKYIAEKYEEPEMKYRPYARWWLAEGSHTDTTLRESIQELYDYGFGGIEFVTLDESTYSDDATYAWGSEEWIHDSKLIIEECQKLGMSVSMTSGTHWSTANLMNITPDEEAASQELGYQTIPIAAGETYSGELPLCELPGESTQQTLVKVILANVVSEATPEESAKLDIESMEDLTSQVTENANGTYQISDITPSDEDRLAFVFYQYGTSESYKPSASGKSYTINYLSEKGADALIDYWNENVLTDDVKTLIGQMDECTIYMDSLELWPQGPNTTNLLWCEDFLDEFEELRGYDLSLYLPFMIYTSGASGYHPNYVFEMAGDDTSFTDNLRNDFFQTQTDLYSNECLGRLKNWVNQNNMTLRAENSYGKLLEISQPVKNLDFVETESLEFAAEVDMNRNIAGAAHLFGKRMSSETGAQQFRNYVDNNGYYRQIFYTQYAAGVQKTVTHGYSSEYGPEEHVSWPGYEGMNEIFSERFNKRQPGSVDYEDLYTHVSRIQKVLEQGVPQMDLGILRTDYNFNCSIWYYYNYWNNIYENKTHSHEGYFWNDMELQDAGYTYDYFSPYLLLDEEVSCTDGLVNADGVAYKALVVMQDELPYAAAEKLLEWAKNGLPVLFVNHVIELTGEQMDAAYNMSPYYKENTIAGSTTGSNSAEGDEALAALVDEMKQLDNVKTVESMEDAYETLKEMGVSPRAEYVESNQKLLSVMRKAEDAAYLYLYHYMYEDEENYQGQVAVEGEYVPYKLDTWSGKVDQVQEYTIEDGRTILDIELAPGDVMILALDPNGEKENLPASQNEGTSEIIELQNWHLSVDAYEPGEMIERTETTESTNVTTTEVTYATNHVETDAGILDSLVSWKDIPEIGAQVSGVGTYTTTFTLPDDWTAEECSAKFQADSFEYGTAALWINGSKVPVNMDACNADISDYVQPGENEIVVRVTSSLRNKMIELGYVGWGETQPEPADYGMTGTAEICFRCMASVGFS